MRELVLIGVLMCLPFGPAFSQTGNLGLFTNSDDIGDPPLKGSTDFDAATGKYKITGSGTDIWGKADQFRYLWREMSGNFAVTATAEFLTEGNGHRKAVIMLRQSPETDAPYCDLVIHGDGMPGVQFRNAKGENTNTVDFPVEGPAKFKMKLARQGANITVSVAKEGGPVRELGHFVTGLKGPVLVGLGVSSHTQTASNTVVFSDVTVEQLPATPATIAPVSQTAAPAGNVGIFTNAADVGSPARKGSTVFDAATGQYRITGSGANIWAQQDQFQFAWKEVSGNFAVTATMEFLGKGAEHRKAGIMVRQSLDTDSAYGDIVIHGNGMPGLQWRSNKGENTNAFDLPIDGPGRFRLKLVRTGVGLAVSIGREGGELKPVARTEVSFKGPVLVGLAVCSHQADASDTVAFSDVSIEQLAAPAPKKQ